MLMIGKKRKTLANGKLIVVDFRNINPHDFAPLYKLSKDAVCQEMAMVAPNGSIYVNAAKPGHKTIAGMFELFMAESVDTLKGYQVIYQKKYPKIKTFDDWIYMKGNASDRMYALAVLSVPIELERRKIEKSYYGIAQ